MLPETQTPPFFDQASRRRNEAARAGVPNTGNGEIISQPFPPGQGARQALQRNRCCSSIGAADTPAGPACQIGLGPHPGVERGVRRLRKSGCRGFTFLPVDDEAVREGGENSLPLYFPPGLGRGKRTGGGRDIPMLPPAENVKPYGRSGHLLTRPIRLLPIVLALANWYRRSFF